MKDKEENVGGELTDLPNAKYVEFFAKFAEIDLLKIEQYKPVHLIGYFVRKYKQQYNVDYKFKFNSTKPSSCFEIFQIKKLAQLLSSRPNILVEYINWIFVVKTMQLKKRFTSISFLTKEENINEYKMMFLSGQPIYKETSISRTISLPAEYLDVLVFAQHGGIKTYGDLAFADQVFTGKDEWEGMMLALHRLGLDRSALKRIA